jgi:hypothetical protein
MGSVDEIKKQANLQYVHNPFRVVIVQFFNGFAPFPNIQGW